MEKNERQKVRIDLIKAMLAGQSWRDASAATESAPLKRAMAYRLVHAVRMRGDAALADGRQGHPSKLRGEVRAFLEDQCSQAPHTPSSTIQATLRDRFDLHVSISQINRVRAALGVSNPSKKSPQEKNGRIRGFSVTARVARRSRQPVIVGGGFGNRTAFLPGDGSHPESFHR